MKTSYRDLLTFVVITLAIFILYNGFQDNYYFSDDYQWIGHAILVDDSFSEIFLVRGRDFNPLLTFFFYVIIKVGGISPLLLRILCFFTFTGALFALYYILSRYFDVKPAIALSAVLLTDFNVYISEVLLYISTFVYTLTLLLFFIALKFFLDGKKVLYLLFMLLAFQVKETIILALIPLFLYEKKRGSRVLLMVSTPLIFLTRFIFQSVDTGSYTHFATTENIFYKLYFLILHPMNLSPFSMSITIGISATLILFIIFAYYLKTDRRILFFGSLFVVYVLFFSFLPRLSSKYYFYPAFAFWGCAALLGDYFYRKSKAAKYFIFVLLIISLLLNYPAIRREVEDYRILGDFSKEYIAKQAAIIKNKVGPHSQQGELIIERQGDWRLRRLHREIHDRSNLLKLLPIRKHSVGGILSPGNLIPLIFYPERIVRWTLIEETSAYFSGNLEISARD
ncbi:hypothetical protein ACFLRB_05920 [Acidobacteriota bacterium]